MQYREKTSLQCAIGISHVPFYCPHFLLTGLMFVLLAVIFILYCLYKKWTHHVGRYPPGPFSLPLIGNLHQIQLGKIKYGGIVELMRVWQKEYGNVITFWLGPTPTVHILDFDIAKEEMIVNGAAYADRYTPYVLDVKREGRGTIFSSGDFWADHRRFTLRTLRDFAMKKNIMEERIMDELQYNFAKVENSMVNGKGKINANEFFDLLVGSVINRIIFSERFTEHVDFLFPLIVSEASMKTYFQENTAEFFELKHLVDKDFASMTAFDMSLDKWTLNLPFFKKKWKTLTEPQEKLVEFIQKRIDRRFATLFQQICKGDDMKEDIASGKHSLDGDGEDFVDAFLIKIEKDRREGRHPSQSYKEDELVYDIFDLWIAGHETTAITVMWGLMHLIKNPTVMEKIRAELQKITNGNRSVSLSDREHTPYMNFAILETQRLASIVNLNLWRRTKEGKLINGHFVPGNTAIAAELSLIMSDERYFKNPAKFDPDRYEKGGKALEQRVIPFGIGKRSCLGEMLAKAELYLILANMISRYEIHEDPEFPIDLRTSTPVGLMHRPKNFNIILEHIKC
ncbi:unnamed protein product [Haemonchus placei]|uniref:Cytochrome P450 n=1 Tax=Haemonchus placei TaxID=6290 RepID=A0A0N4WRL5_HAEPC|nr:unnamed protein product [Haemonchus placei]